MDARHMVQNRHVSKTLKYIKILYIYLCVCIYLYTCIVYVYTYTFAYLHICIWKIISLRKYMKRPSQSCKITSRLLLFNFIEKGKKYGLNSWSVTKKPVCEGLGDSWGSRCIDMRGAAWPASFRLESVLSLMVMAQAFNLRPPLIKVLPTAAVRIMSAPLSSCPPSLCR